MQKVRLGWQQKEVLKRINEHPGLSSATILKGLKRGNQPEKKLEAHGFIKNKPDDNSNRWFITKKGRERLEAYITFD